MSSSAMTRQGGNSEDNFAWLNRSLGNILGGGPALALMRGERSLRDASNDEVRHLAVQIDRRFVRVVEPRTGQVSFRIEGPAVTLEDGETRNAPLARRAGIVLPAVRKLLGEVDPERCRPQVCAGEIRETLAHIDITLDAVETELTGTGVPALTTHLFRELLEKSSGGLLERLRRYLRPGDGRLLPTVEDERQIGAVEEAGCMLENLQAACDGVNTPQEFVDLSNLLMRADRCAGTITDQASLNRSNLAELGIGRCELATIQLQEVSEGAEHEAALLSRASFDDLLSIAEREPRRCQRLSRLGGASQLRAIREIAGELHKLTRSLKGRRLAGRLALRGEAKERVAMDFDRLGSVVAAFVVELGGEAPDFDRMPAPASHWSTE